MRKLGLIEYGAIGAWPQQGVRPELIHHALYTVGTALNITMAETTRPATMYRKIMAIVHTDKHMHTGARVDYVALAVGAMVQQCHAVCEGDSTSGIRAMPPIMITPFDPAGAQSNPPFWYEFNVAEVAAPRDTTRKTIYHVHGPQVRATRSIWLGDGGTATTKTTTATTDEQHRRLDGNPHKQDLHTYVYRRHPLVPLTP